jgi:poly(A) polymerase
VEQPRFRAGFDFLRLRADAGEIDDELAEWWEDFSLGDAEEREAMLEAARRREPARRSRTEVAAPRSAAAGADTQGDDGHDTGESAEPARKRRRRRRKPSAAATAQGGPAPQPE